MNFLKRLKKNENLKNKEIELVILAPKEYYDTYFSNEKVREKFNELLHLFDEKISLKTINFNSDDVMKKLLQYPEKIENLKLEPKTNTKQYNAKKKVTKEIVEKISKEFSPKIENYQ